LKKISVSEHRHGALEWRTGAVRVAASIQLLFVILFFAIFVIHHGVSRADKALVVGDAV
jgi:hypothetical protein